MSLQEVRINAFDEKITIKRVLGSIQGTKNAPTVICFGGIHGNERAGVYALIKVLKTIEKEKIPFLGNFYAISGNINALQKNIRFEDIDLNRIWSAKKIQIIDDFNKNIYKESFEQQEIYKQIKEIVKKDKGPFYFIDLHTTSSDTSPFITISDSLNNREFSSNFSIPTILGIEEYLDGPLLTFINEFGHISLGFEAGEHYKESSVDNCEAFIWLALKASGCVNELEIKKLSYYQHVLSLYKEKQEFYEINYKYEISKNEQFEMLFGFSNFESVVKGQELAISNSKKIRAAHSGKIFMPLYQKQGEDGFFIISLISKKWLVLSTLVRRLKMHYLLRSLPGIQQDKSNKHILIVNPKTARFLATEIFHLFGYRKKVIKDTKYYFIKRDRKVTELF
tara:strand:+ start:1659 stop:2840 length:1182 start_codon:yes stop_codon:yes gene_type:complete